MYFRRLLLSKRQTASAVAATMAGLVAVHKSIYPESLAEEGGKPLNRNFIADASDLAAPSVVNIVADTAVAKFLVGQSSGSGFVLNKDGFIVTNAHVVNKAANNKVYVTLWKERRRREAVVHSMDKATDLALVKLVDPPEDLPVATIGASGSLRVGEFVVALGSPLLLMNSVTAGIVSATARHGSELGMGGGARTEYIQTDAAINVGNSGGPLVNLDGEVVGINTMKAQAEGMSFAIPIDTAMQIIKQLIVRRKASRPILGIKIVNFIPSMDEAGSGGGGGRGGKKSRRNTIVESGEDAQVLVMDVEHGGPAHVAGLRNGDIITQVDGKNLHGVRDFMSIIGFGDESKTLHLTISRQQDGAFGGYGGGGGSSELEITVRSKPRD
jgi:HtrA serine peptidase 2